MTLLFAILAFNLIIIVHELGHFIVAKLCDIKVHEFSLFFGPKIFSIKIGETMYSLRLIPVLAYVKLEGEDEPSDNERSYSQKPLLARMAVIAAGPIANILLATVLLVVFYSISGYETTKINNVAEGSPAYDAGIRPGDTVVSYDNKRVYQPIDAMLFLYADKGSETDIVVSRDGYEVPLRIKPFVLPEKRYLLGFVPKEFYGKDSNVVEKVSTGEPAAGSGLKEGDRIKAIDGDPVTSMQDITRKLTESGGKKLRVTVLRDAVSKDIYITPTRSTNSENYDIGVSFEGNVKGNVFDVIKQSLVATYAYTREMIYSVVWLFQGKFPLRDMSGPVGIVAAINGAVQQEPTILDKFLSLLRMMVFISVGLGISNLLPIPPADGSKLILLTVEGVRRKPLPAEKEGLIMMAGFIFMMLLFVLILFNDIYNINLGRFSR